MHLLGRHQVSLHTIRRLAVLCTALDSHAHQLFNDGYQENKSGKMRLAYEELLTENLLLLAASVRTKFYQGLKPNDPLTDANHAGVLSVFICGEEQEVKQFNIKDVCDKIIHAEQINKSVSSERDSILIEFQGKRTFGKKVEIWTMALSVALFCGTIIDWIDRLEEATE